MEKLQAAVERARKQRETQGVSPAPQAPRIQKPAAAAGAANGTAIKGIARPADQTAGQPAPAPAGDWDAFPEHTTSDRAALRRRIFVDGRSKQTAYFDKLRTKIMQICRDNDWRRIAITSATKGCGKTTIACNLAASFTRQKDRRLILLDADMRRPELANQFGHRATQGLAEMLDGRAAFSDVAFRLGHNVLVAANYAPHPNPAQLLLQDRTPEILSEIEATYAPDLVIFDTPPLLATDDTLAILKHVDCALIVAAAERTTTSEVDVVEKEIAEQTNVLGVVLNQCIYMDNKEDYYYYR